MKNAEFKNRYISVAKSVLCIIFPELIHTSDLQPNPTWRHLSPPKDPSPPHAGRPFLPFSSLLETDTLFHMAINKTWLFFFSPPPPTPLCNHPVVRHWVVTSMLYHSTWLYSERTWQLRAALCLRRSPFQPFSLSPQPASVFSSEWVGGGESGGVVKCIIYPCLPP